MPQPGLLQKLDILKAQIWIAKRERLDDLHGARITLTSIALEAHFRSADHAEKILRGDATVKVETAERFVELMTRSFLRLLPANKKTRRIRAQLRKLLPQNLPIAALEHTLMEEDGE